jgi:hypothetical protein
MDRILAVGGPASKLLCSRAVRLSAEDVLAALAKGEGTRREFKRTLPRDDKVARTLCAFANTRGGLLLVGVTDRKRVHGVHRADDVAGELERIARQDVEPELTIELQIVEVHGPRIVACSAPLSKDRPHLVLRASGKREVVVRVGASNRGADGPTLRALQRQSGRRTQLSPLDERILAWVARQAATSSHPGGTATVARFAKLHNVSERRAHKAFVKLEHMGLLLGYGAGRARIFHAA